MTTTKNLPPLLARFVIEHPLGSGKSVYLRELPGATEQDLEAWASDGWLKKSVCSYDEDGEERVIELDADTGDYYDDYGSFVRSSDLVTNYMTTDQAHETPEAKAAGDVILAIQLRARLAGASRATTGPTRTHPPLLKGLVQPALSAALTVCSTAAKNTALSAKDVRREPTRLPRKPSSRAQRSQFSRADHGRHAEG